MEKMPVFVQVMLIITSFRFKQQKNGTTKKCEICVEIFISAHFNTLHVYMNFSKSSRMRR